MIRTYKYSNETLNEVYTNLLNFKNQGNAKDFEIRIDDFTVVQRTKNLNNFNSFKKSLNAYSAAVSILFYKGNSRKYDKYTLERTGKVSPNPNKETEDYINGEVAKLIEEQNKEIESVRLHEQNKHLKKRVKRLKRQNRDLEVKQKNSLKEIISLVTTSLPQLTGSASSIPKEINGIETESILKMLNDKREKWGDKSFMNVLGIALSIGDDPELLAEVEQLVVTKNDKNEEREEE